MHLTHHFLDHKIVSDVIALPISGLLDVEDRSFRFSGYITSENSATNEYKFGERSLNPVEDCLTVNELQLLASMQDILKKNDVTSIHIPLGDSVAQDVDGKIRYTPIKPLSQTTLKLGGR